MNTKNLRLQCHKISLKTNFSTGSLKIQIINSIFHIIPSISPKKPPLQNAIKIEPFIDYILERAQSKSEKNLNELIARRKPILQSKVNIFPFSTIVHLESTFLIFGKQHHCSGSGVFVGPRHVLTANHNVFHNIHNWALSIIVTPALHNKFSCFGNSNVIQIHSFTINSDDPSFDLALLILDQDLGYKTGWMGIAAIENNDELEKLYPQITGYPSNKNFDMFTHLGSITKASKELLDHDIDTGPGNCGSPMWVDMLWLGSFVIAIHSQVNYGCRITKFKLECLVEYINKTWGENENISIIKVSGNSQEFRWICSICTTINSKSMYVCEVCQNLKDIRSKSSSEISVFQVGKFSAKDLNFENSVGNIATKSDKNDSLSSISLLKTGNIETEKLFANSRKIKINSFEDFKTVKIEDFKNVTEVDLNCDE